MKRGLLVVVLHVGGKRQTDRQAGRQAGRQAETERRRELPGGKVERGLLVVVLHAGRGPEGDEFVQRQQMALLGSVVQRRATHLIPLVQKGL